MDAAWFHLALAALATWRLVTLLVHDDGPWDVMWRLRRELGHGQIARMLDCFHCVSLWVAAPLAFAVGRGPIEWLMAWLALSGAACLLDRVSRAPPLIQRLNDEGDVHGLLRSETRGDGNGERDADAARRPAGDDAGPLHFGR